MEPRALVFDAYGTLFDVHSVAVRCEEFWPGRGAQLSQLWRARQLEYSWQRSLMRRYVPFSTVTREALEYACETLGLPLAAGAKSALMDAYLKLATYPDVAQALRALGSRTLAILSNGSPDMLAPLVAHNGLDSAFAAVISVDERQFFKPAPQAYQLAAERLGLEPAGIGFVSSNCWDALGAKSFGFSVYWINRAAAPVDRLGCVPDGILRTLGDLPPMLAAA